jgi:hypothetical protein
MINLLTNIIIIIILIIVGIRVNLYVFRLILQDPEVNKQVSL